MVETTVATMTAYELTRTAQGVVSDAIRTEIAILRAESRATLYFAAKAAHPDLDEAALQAEIERRYQESWRAVWEGIHDAVMEQVARTNV